MRSVIVAIIAFGQSNDSWSIGYVLR